MDGNAFQTWIDRVRRLLVTSAVVYCAAASNWTPLLAQQPSIDSAHRAGHQSSALAPSARFVGGDAVVDLPPISIDEFYHAYALREPAMTVVDETAQLSGRTANGINPAWVHSVNDFRLVNGELVSSNQSVEPLLPEGIQAPGTPQPAQQEQGIPNTATAGQTAGATQPLNQQTTLGQAPENFSQVFLRRQSVLLGQGEYQMDIGMAYTLFQSDFTSIVPPGTLVESQIRRRLLTVPLEFRYGLTDTTQVFINAPLGYANTELSQIGYDEFSSKGGIGDTNIGASMILYKGQGCANDPDVILTTGVTIPTSEATLLSGVLGTPTTNLGQGYWAAYWNLLFVHAYDPCVVFYGFGSRHQFEQEVDGFNVLPGGQYSYQLGVGFSVNERITLSTAFLGAYISEAYVNDIRVQGSIQEPMVMRFAVTIAQPCKIVEPFAEIGMTDDAPAARIGITCTY